MPLPDPHNAPDQAPQRAKRAAVACIRKFDGCMTRSRFVVTAASSPERNEDLERRWSDDLPTMAPAQFGRLPLVHRGEGAVRPLLLLQQPARPGRSIEKQYSPGFRAAVLPGMRHAAGHEGAGAGAADRDLLADLERDLAAEDIGHLVAVVMQMERAQCPGGNGFLEQHDAAAGRSTQQFERREPTEEGLRPWDTGMRSAPQRRLRQIEFPRHRADCFPALPHDANGLRLKLLRERPPLPFGHDTLLPHFRAI